VVADQWALTRDGETGIRSYLTLVSAALEAPNESLVEIVVPTLRFIDHWLVPTDERPAWRSWVRDRIQPLHARLGWTRRPGEPDGDAAMRAAAIDVMGTIAADADVRDQAVAQVRADLAGTPLDPSIAGAAYTVAAQHGGPALYDQIQQALNTDPRPAVFYRRQSALARFPEPELATRTVAFALSSEVRNQDAPLLLGALAANDQVRSVVWPLLKKHWAEVERKTGISLGTTNVIRGISACSEAERTDIESFFEHHPVPNAANSLQLLQEQIDGCIVTRRSQETELIRDLRQRTF
jgi:aminopeptidase N